MSEQHDRKADNTLFPGAGALGWSVVIFLVISLVACFFIFKAMERHAEKEDTKLARFERVMPQEPRLETTSGQGWKTMQAEEAEKFKASGWETRHGKA